MTLRIYLVHSQRYVRENMRRAMKDDESLRLIGYSRSGSQAIRRRIAQTSDLVLYEIDRSPQWTEALQRFCTNLRSIVPETPVVALGTRNDQEAAQAICAGAYGTIPDDLGSARMRRVLSALHERRPEATPSLAAEVLRKIRETALQVQSREVRLTPRQEQVLELLELTDEQIGRRLGIQVATVKSHIHAILKAFGARDRRHALELAGHRSEATEGLDP